MSDPESKPQGSPSADEEVETPLVDAAFAEYPVMDTQRGGDAITIQAARAIEKQLRQQHNSEREDVRRQRDDAMQDSERRMSLLEQRDLELQQLRASLAEAEDRISWLETQREVEAKQKIDAQNEAEGFCKDVDKLKSELATAQRQLETIAAIVSSEEDFSKPHAYVYAVEGYASERDRVERERDSLRSQLQTAMEERDAAIRNRDEWRNAATESKQAYGAANSRLEEAMGLLRDVLKYADMAPDAERVIKDFLSRLSTSRETENKT